MKRIVLALSIIVVGCQAANVEDTVLKLVEEGKVSQAQEIVRKSGATGRELGRLQGILYHSYGMADSALVYLKQAYADAPNDPVISLRLAEVLFWKKDLRTVRTIVEKVSDKSVATGPRKWETMMHKAQLQSWLQEFDSSRRLYQGVLDASGTPDAVKVQCRYHLAEIAAWKKDFAKSLSMLDALLASIPGYVDASLLKGQILEWQGKYAEARNVYTSGLQRHPTDALLRARLEKLSWVK